MRENMRMALNKGRMNTTRHKQERNQMEQEMNNLWAQLCSSDQDHQAAAAQLHQMQLHCKNLRDQFEARDVENSLNETEMADQILQFEKQVEQFKSANISLV